MFDELKMSKEERQAYDNFIDARRYGKGILDTAFEDGKYEERKIQEAKIKQLENKHSKELKKKDNKLKEKDNKLREMAKLLLENGLTKKQIFEKTGIKL